MATMNGKTISELYGTLQTYVERGLVNSREDGPFILYNYARCCQLDKKLWDEYTRMCRGLIIDRRRWRIAAKPFPKFFNYGEMTYKIPDEPFTVYEKLDGSLGIVWYDEYGKTWRVTTRGSFDSDQAIWATKFLNANCNLDWLKPDHTYLVEIVYPDNRIVIDYDGRHALVLLAVYNNDTCEEVAEIFDTSIAEMAGFERPKIYQYYSIKKLVELAETLPGDDEGFVVRFKNGYRVKIKGAEYLRLHKLLSDFTPLRVWEWARDGVNVTEKYRDLPEEFHDDLDAWLTKYFTTFESLHNRVHALTKQYAHLTDKELGLLIQNERNYGHAETAFDFLFAARKKDWLKKSHMPGRERNAAFATFRPRMEDNLHDPCLERSGAGDNAE